MAGPPANAELDGLAADLADEEEASESGVCEREGVAADTPRRLVIDLRADRPGRGKPMDGLAFGRAVEGPGRRTSF